MLNIYHYKYFANYRNEHFPETFRLFSVFLLMSIILWILRLYFFTYVFYFLWEICVFFRVKIHNPETSYKGFRVSVKYDSNITPQQSLVGLVCETNSYNEAFAVVIAGEGIEGAQLHPAQTQFPFGVTEKGANIRANLNEKQSAKSLFVLF